MAVEAQHRRSLFPPQLVRNRETMIGNMVTANTNNQMVYVPPMMMAPAIAGISSGVSSFGGGVGGFVPFYNPCVSVATGSDSGVTSFNDALSPSPASAMRKRERASFLGEDADSFLQQQQIDIDRIVLQHVERVRAGIAVKRKRFSNQILAKVEEGMQMRLQAKEEEIERIGKLNWVLEERIKSLSIENQIWRDLAQNNEATANVLRNNLEQVLAAQQIRDCAAATAGDVEDAESCCGGDEGQSPATAEAALAVGAAMAMRVCRRCEKQEPAVLLLPCRHLCLCSACAPETDSCPVCKCYKSGSVLVNMSP